MRDTNLYRDYTMTGMLDKLDVIECFERPRRRASIGEILEEQRDLYLALGVDVPTSL